MPRRELPAALLAGPFRLSDLRRWGLPDQLVRTRRFRRLFHGVYAASCLPDTLRLRVEAAALILPASAVFSHHTAAGLRDLPVPSSSHLHVTVPPGTAAPRGNGILAPRASVEGGAVTTSRGVRTTTPVRTFLDLGRSIGLIDVVVLGDAMVRRSLASVGELQDAASRASGRGSSAIRTAAPLVRGRVDSPMETRVRLLLALAGLPDPEPGVEVLDDHRWSPRSTSPTPCNGSRSNTTVTCTGSANASGVTM
ncbi:hypothetical protein [Actinopolymorpha sp. B9G3]|uniref:hypothetical protein n=1 Tax=Actinopolymorpha sp. B9G3 TaxID=3158970 RepID=UPI0032D8E35A